ncbi:MAG: prepilin-type N-terminal cleavage/methylation domain-containing protein [Alkalibacterium sp.]|nr:prepilin-type N-terminal cleavage/methylation domain-containing protein [Alkalibacterium sp.]
MMKKWIRNEDGITLVELLASIVLLSVVILLAGSVHIFGQTQFINQTESASQSNDLRYSMSVISKDVRKAESVTSDSQNTLIADDITYNWTAPVLYRNGEIISKQVGYFMPEVTEDKADITIESTSNRQGQTKKYQTTIYFRR